jgi:hypothetical protein
LESQLGSAFHVPNFANQYGTFHTPYYEQWSLGIQQAIGDKSSLSLTYVGNHGVRIPVEDPAYNAWGAGYPPFPNSPASPVFAAVTQYSSGGISNYNGLTASYSQRLTYGFTVQASYTWSHAMDEISNGGQEPFVFTTNESILYQINPACLRCNNYGNADYDISSYFSGSYVWQTPWKFGNKFVNGAIGGWMISQNFFARTGLPFTVEDGTNGINNFAPSILPATVLAYGQSGCGSQSNYVTGTPCLNINNFTSGGVTGVFPNQRRNTYNGPGFFDSDLSVAKSFKLTERMALSVGANFYNVFNHPNFDQPDANIADQTFGQVVTTAPLPTGPYGAFFANLPSARIIQFQGKIVF